MSHRSIAVGAAIVAGALASPPPATAVTLPVTIGVEADFFCDGADIQATIELQAGGVGIDAFGDTFTWRYGSNRIMWTYDAAPATYQGTRSGRRFVGTMDAGGTPGCWRGRVM